MVVIAAGIKAERSACRALGSDRRARDRRRQPDASVDDPDIYVARRMRAASRTGLRIGRSAFGSRPRCSPITSPGANRDAAYHGSKIATKLKVMGVEVASMGIVEPTEEGDEVVQFTEPKKGTYKKLIIRNGRLVGSILLGDISKAPYLTQAFERNTPLPDERLSLLFDIGAPSGEASIEEMPADMQVCNCNGVTKGAIVGCVKRGKRTPKSVMEATRAGMGCGACKRWFQRSSKWACGGAADDDPSCRLLCSRRSADQAGARARDSRARAALGLAVFAELAGGKEDPASKPGLASLLNTLWHDEYEDERDARFINDRVHANIQKDGTFSVIPQIPGGVTSADAAAADRRRGRQVPRAAGQADGRPAHRSARRQARRPARTSGATWACRRALPTRKRYRTCKSCVGTDFCRYRARRQHRPRAEDRAALPGLRHARAS